MQSPVHHHLQAINSADHSPIYWKYHREGCSSIKSDISFRNCLVRNYSLLDHIISGVLRVLLRVLHLRGLRLTVEAL
jgi:hypothetical protein